MPTKPYAFHDLPADSFPFTVEALDASGAVVWTTEVTGPGALYVPPLATFYGPVSVRLRFPDGSVITGDP